MSLRIVFQREAKANLRHAVAWWSENRSPEQAIRWLDGIYEAIAKLSRNPERCAVARESRKAGEELRELHFGLGSRPSHRIIFVVDPEVVRILAIRHAAQDDWDQCEEETCG